MIVNGWTLLFHEAIIVQVKNLADAYERTRKGDPKGFRSNGNVKLLAALAKLVLEIIPADPSRPEYRQGNTLGAGYRHWRRAKFYQQFRLFFRYREAEKIIVYAWINDASTRRAYDSKTDAYAVFKKMLDAGNPPDDWAALMAACGEDASKRLDHAAAEVRR